MKARIGIAALVLLGATATASATMEVMTCSSNQAPLAVDMKLKRCSTTATEAALVTALREDEVNLGWLYRNGWRLAHMVRWSQPGFLDFVFERPTR
ncbi:MAG: hypothetical protein ACR2P8_14940 [Myxococcota bacterium]